MAIFAAIMDWLLILALIGFFGAIAAIVMSGLKLKNTATASFRKLSGPPIERGKILVNTGKGIVQQETIRAKHMGASAGRAASAVKVTVNEAKVAIDALKDADLEPLMEQAQAAVKFASAAASVMRAASKQGASEA